MKGIAVKTKELTETLRLIKRVLSDPRLEPDGGDQLRRAARELETVERSGKLERDKIFRAIRIVATVLSDLVKSDASQK